MRRFLTPLLLMLSAPTFAADPDALAREVAAAETAFAQSMADRDFEAFARFVADDALFINGTRAQRGKAAVLAAWKPLFEGDAAPFSWSPEAANVLDTGELAQTKGPVLDPDGKLIAHFRSTWRRESPGVWRVVFDDGYAACPCMEKAEKMTHVEGEFEVTVSPQPADERALGAAIGRLSIDKQFHGALEARSEGQMLAFRSAVEGSAGYVAMERVDGTLDGRRGSFVVQHLGVMDRGAQTLDLRVVPDSGTGELAGLSGTLGIEIVDGKHRYTFDYALPAAN